jgi:signal transduction histidine kinase
LVIVIRRVIVLQDRTDEAQVSLPYLPPTRRQARAALVWVVVLLLGSAVLIPLAAKPLPKFEGFIPALDAIISVTDLITACLLLVHFSITRLGSLRALACGYLFSAAIVIAHGITFPGVISPTGIGGSTHTNFRIYLLWHLGLPVASVAYIWLRGKDNAKASAHPRTEILATFGMTGVLAAVSCIAWLALLPPVDPVAGRWLTAITMSICAVALAVLWSFRRSALDEWLMIVALAMIIELAMTALIGGFGPRSTVTLGFYAGRLFSLVTSTIVLVALLTETSRLHADVARANTLARALKAEAELVHANRIASMGQLAASIVHEVNQPIAATLLNAEIAVRWLARQPPDLEKAKQSLDRILGDAKRGAAIVSRIRDFSKKATVQTESLGINGVVLDIVALTRVAMSEHDISFRTELSEELPHILGDKVQLQQVILNLTMNAIEAMSEVADGPRELQINTSKADAVGILVTVSDTGPGLPQADPQPLFEAFYTTKASGLGMGLSICRAIIQNHGGQLWAKPNEPRGAVFSMILPIGDRSFEAREFSNNVVFEVGTT